MRGDVNVDIEDVLRQHSVQELRELVQQLQQEGQNKQTELQQMVKFEKFTYFMILFFTNDFLLTVVC